MEAVSGAPSDVASREAVGNATALLHRLTAERLIVPLNLFHAGSFGAGAGSSDQPDFLATRETLPYVFSLIGGRNWKSGPGDKASPLMKEIWALLNGEGALTAREIQTALGRELTEAAVLRGLLELWGGLRVIPVYDSETTRWELTQARFAAEMTASQKVAQATALSALVSFYLQAVIAASSEEVETFLSPLTARSRVREVVNGLQATRQLGLVSVNAQPLVYVAGSLPEFAEEEPERVEPRAGLAVGLAGAAFAAGLTKTRESSESRPRERPAQREEQRPFERRDQRGFQRGERREGTGQRRGYDKERTYGERPPRKPFDKERGAGRERGRGDRERFGKKRFDSDSRGFERGKRFDRERGEERRGERQERSGFRGGEGRRERGEYHGGGKFPPKKKAGGERSWQERGERRGYERPEARREEGGKKFWEREREPRGKRENERGRERRGDERRADERGGERRPGRFSDGKKFGGGKFSGEKRFGGPKKFGGKRFEGEKRFGGPKKFGSRGPSKEFDREKRAPYRERESERGAERSSRSEASFKQRGERGPRQGKPEFRGSGKPKFGGNKFGERAAGNAGYKKRDFGKSGKPFGKAGRKSDSGKRKESGGFKPPFRKRKDRESESGE